MKEDENISIDDFYQKWERSIRLSVAPIYQDQEIEKFRQDLKRIRLNTEPETPAIPERWCVKRTPENAEVLQAWRKATFEDKQYWSQYGHTDLEYLHSGSGIVWDYVREGHTEITFEQWKTIPEHAEWLKDYDTQFIEAQEKVEEREIIGWAWKEEFKFLEPSLKMFPKCFTPNINPSWDDVGDIAFEHNSKMLEYVNKAGVLHWFDPVYRNPVFKVGDWIKDKGSGLVMQVMGVNSASKRYDAGPVNIYFDFAIAATPEEIEAARPREIWEKYPTWESLDIGFNEVFSTIGFSTNEHAASANAHGMLSQLEKAWNEGKQGLFTIVARKRGEEWYLNIAELAKWETAQIKFATQSLAEKSLELHGDLWRKYWMI